MRESELAYRLLPRPCLAGSRELEALGLKDRDVDHTVDRHAAGRGGPGDAAGG